MNRLRLIIQLCLASITAIGQENPFYVPESIPKRDSMDAILQHPKDDQDLIKAYRELGFSYYESRRDTALYFYEKGLELARKKNWKLWEADAENSIGFGAYIQGNYPRSLQFLQHARAIAEDPKSEQSGGFNFGPNTVSPKYARLSVLQRTHNHLGSLYGFAGNFRDFKSQEMFHLNEALRITEELNDTLFRSIVCMNLGRHYSYTGDLDSLQYWSRKALELAEGANYTRYKGNILRAIGDSYFRKDSLTEACPWYWQSLDVSRRANNLRSLGDGYLALTTLYRKAGKLDSSLFYGNMAISAFASTSVRASLADAYLSTSRTYQLLNNIDSAYKYQDLALGLRDEESNRAKMKQFQNMNFDETLRQEQIAKEKSAYVNRIRTNVLLAGLGTLVLVAVLLLRNNRQRRKANTLLQQQKEELSHTLAELKTTQAQLVQSEKMASLGELTAGIAHEIQNPLNFVNNFSDVNTEMIDELTEELSKGNISEARALVADIRENEIKINHHGKRADSIVKGMLQHSRTDKGQKEPTDINALVDEYLRLSYHGQRAKNKSFNASLITDFDDSIGQINIIPQDISRVLLNLFNNAFYAVSKEALIKMNEGYEPTVVVSTKRLNDKIEILVKDNGTGIPEKIKGKISQPFFTTKAPGEGTGLGLSLSYDIIKVHGGEIKVESKEGEGTMFSVNLPI